MTKPTTYRHPKPRPDFPLFPHDTNRWAKKILGKLRYFGKVLPDDPRGEQALQRWLDQKDELLAGRVPKAKLDTLTIEAVVNSWLDAKRQRVSTGELSTRSWDDYRKLGVILVETWGRNRAAVDLGPGDFSKLRDVMSRRWGPVRLGNQIQYVKGMFGWAQKEGLLPLPSYGAGFARPTAKTVRAVKNGHGSRMIEPGDIHKLLAVASPNMRAAILLAANGGIGPSDLARLPISALDLQAGWANYARHKTAIARRIPLWPETVEAIQEAIAKRPEPLPGHEAYVFLRPTGRSYLTARGEWIGEEFRLVAKAAGVKHAMYDLRRGFQTISERAGDPVATASVMGHAPRSGDMAATYRQTIDDSRLVAVVTVVRGWLFGDGSKPTGKPTSGRKPIKAAKQAPADGTLQRAISKARKTIQAADGETRRCLASVWNESEFQLAESGESATVQRFIEVWGDDDQEPRLRIVG